MKLIPIFAALVLLFAGTSLVHAAPVPERLIVLFDALPSDVRTHGHFLDADVLQADNASATAVVQASDGQAFRAQAAHRSDVRVIEADTIHHALGFTPNDPQFSTSQFAPQMMGAPAAWSTTMGSTAVTICLVDTGIRYTHQDLAAHYRGGYDFVNKDNNPMDDGGHGTRTAGVAAAVINNGVGVAGMANVAVKSAKALDSAGSGYMSNIALGIRWCADNGANIISMSFGSSSGGTTLKDAIDYASNKGIVLVAGSGNGGCTNCVLYPAAYSNVIGVGSVEQSYAVSSFMSQGPEVDLAAPGSNIQTTAFSSDTAYVRGGGTSISAPEVAGAAALVWSAHPSYTAAQVRQALEATAQDVGPGGMDNWSGHGLVRADRAIAYGSAPVSTVFTATFAPSASSNEWWVEVKVTASSTPAKVEAIAAGASHILAKTSWGTNAASFSLPKGTSVVFKATSTSGGTASSTAIAWLGTATSTTTTTTTTAAGFTATFTPKGVGNDWWVETGVTSSQTIAKVQAKVNGGALVDLPKDTWGTYAKSLNAPNGSQVVFVATSTSGATATSTSYTWT